MNNFDWPLNQNNFTPADRVRISEFFLNENKRWTQDEEVKNFERKMGDKVESNAIFVSSGSAANTLLAYYAKDKILSKNSARNIVVLPSVTWQTSCSPWIREGFEPKFIDVTLSDFSMDLTSLECFLEQEHQRVAVVFITSLLGFVPDIGRILYLKFLYPEVRFMLDNCENTFGSYDNKNVSHYLTSTTSTYFGHQLQSIEGGFIFTRSKEEYDYFIMARNHGMTRGLRDPSKYENKSVSPLFDFALLGNNFRNSDVNAFIGQIDLERWEEYRNQRIDIYNYFRNSLKSDYLFPLETSFKEHVAFALPIIAHRTLGSNSGLRIHKVAEFCKENKIETRPIVSGNLLRQTPYKKYGLFSDFANAEWLHKNGLYVGLYPNLDVNKVADLVEFLNKL